MADTTNTLNFTYDPDGIALGVNLNGTDYYYLYNAQGDVIALYDSTGTIVVEYVYDSWGKLLSTTGSGASTIGALNPLRYRGYFYDTDLSLYLLETRYYDPETGRFINADGVVDNRGVETTNLYSYCGNNPVNNRDDQGQSLRGALIGAAVGGLVGAVVGGVKAYKKHKGTKNVRKNVLKAAGKGALQGAFVGALVGGLGARGLRIASAASKLNKARKVYIAKKSIYQGAASFGTHYTNRMVPKVSAYCKKINAAATYVPPEKRSSSSYQQIKAATVQLGKSAIPTQGDLAAGALGASLGLMAGRSSAIKTGLGEVGEFVAPTLISDIKTELLTSVAAAGFEELVAELYPGESS